MKQPIYAVTLALLLTLVIAQAQVVHPNKRAEILEESEAVLNTNVEQYKEQVASIRSPFYIPQAEKPVVEQKKVIEVVKVVSKKAILEIAAQQLDPSGSLIKGDRSFIQSKVGMIATGSQFIATYNNQQYTVSLTEVTSDYYVLKLDDETLKTYFNPDDETRIQKGQNVTDRPGINEIPVLPTN